MRENEPRAVFESGFDSMLESLAPKRIVVYGSRRSPKFAAAEHKGIEVLQFDTNTANIFAKTAM